MISLNKAILIGNATRDPELRYTPSGQGVCNFSIATNRRFKNAAGDIQEETQYHDIVAWGKLAEIICQIIKKGNKIYVEGRLQTRQWDAPDGTKRSRTEVVLEQFVPLTPKSAAASGFDASTTEAPAKTAQSAGKPAATPAKPKKTATPDKKTANKPAPAGDETSQVTPDTDEINLDDIPF